MKSKARRVAATSWGYNDGLYHGDMEKLEKELKKVERKADHLKACSCSMCRNPRHNGWCSGITKQEYLSLLKFLENVDQDDRVKHARYPSR
jgi:hypothetical protein